MSLHPQLPQQATIYSKISSHQKETGLKVLAKLNLQPGMRVLDLGCGTGYLASVIAQHVGPTGSVLGVDPDQERIRFAKEIYGDGNVTFMEGNSDTFPADGDQYDVILANYVLHWVSDKENAFKRVFRSLKPGGRFGFTVTVEFSRDFDDILHLMPSIVIKLQLHCEPLSYYQTLADTCGFATEVENLFDRNYTFRNIDEALDYCFAVTHGKVNPGNSFNKERFDQFKQRFGSRSVEHTLAIALEMVLKKTKF